MPDFTTTTNPNPNNSSIFTFKPRQVILAQHHKKIMSAAAEQQRQNKALLNNAIVKYLKSNGFGKTAKKFLSEAEFENTDWEASSLDLEGIFGKYMETCTQSGKELNTSKGQETCATNEDITEKKKKKKKKSGDGDSHKEVATDITSTSLEAKPKEKKSKNPPDSSDKTEQVKSDAVKLAVEVTTPEVTDGSIKKSKDKKKKKKHVEKDELETSLEQTEEKSSNVERVETKKVKKDVDQTNLVKPDAAHDNLLPSVEKEKKSSKKRKRVASDNNEFQGTEVEATKEPKQRKTEGLQEIEKEELHSKVDTLNSSEGKNVQDGHEPKKLPTEDLEGHSNGKLDLNGADNSSSQKTKRKQHNGSAEPKSVNAFQRVKVDQVVFADDKLQDNSYWAKDGADVGYGAKAQEVLGQVKGRDFRHEKTKKKRGSYRGGQIDLQSHSIKFNYSDDE